MTRDATRITRRFVTTRRRQAGQTGTLAVEAWVIDVSHDAVHDWMHFLHDWIVFVCHRHGLLLRGRGTSGQTRVNAFTQLLGEAGPRRPRARRVGLFHS